MEHEIGQNRLYIEYQAQDRMVHLQAGDPLRIQAMAALRPDPTLPTEIIPHLITFMRHSRGMSLFSYPNMSSMSTMSGVISPTNLSMYSSAVTNSGRNIVRSSSVGVGVGMGVGVPRWTTTPFITLDQEDFNMMTHPVNASNTEPNAIILMDEERFFQSDGTDGLSHEVASVAVQVPVGREMQESNIVTMSAPKSP